MADAAAATGAALAPRFDAAHYLAANPDLRLTAAEAADHYERIGRAEGRVASPLALRENLIALIDDGRSVLEIGPFCNPLLRGPNIAYLDILDADALRARALETGGDPAGCPSRIDYVGGLEQVGRRFDAIISSHAIEHQPDLVQHLGQIERILDPDGLFCLIIPDKRYCFDHFIAESTIADVLEAHREQRRVHSFASVIEHVALTTHNDPQRHWRGDHGPAVPSDRAARLRKAIADHEAGAGGYIDVHAWYFTPDSFADIIGSLAALDLIGLELAGVYDSAFGRNEFCAVLRLGRRAQAHARRLAGAGGMPGDAVPVAPVEPAPTRMSSADERWLSRLAHRGGLQPPLIEAPVPAVRADIAAKICALWRGAGGGAATAFTAALDRGDAAAVAAELAALGRSPIGFGLLGGDRQHKRAQSRQFAERLAIATHDRLVSLAEAIGVLPIENPENGDWGRNPLIEPAELFRIVSEALGADLTPPRHVGGHLGIDVGGGAVIHMRMLDAIYAAWRLRQFADSLGLGADARIAEIGAGAGLTAFYALRLGMKNYRLYDRPAMGAVQAHVLMGEGFDPSLPGGAEDRVAVLHDLMFMRAEAGSIDILFNADSLPQLGLASALGHLADARRLGIGHLLSINHEVRLPDQRPVVDLVRLVGGYILASRHRHWLRAGYVEEYYRIP